MEVKHAQGSGTTNLYPANKKVVGHGSRQEKVWSGGRENGEPILRFSLKPFSGKCHAGMTYHPKEEKISWNHQIHVVRDRNVHPYPDGNATVNKQTKQISLSNNGMWQGQHRYMVVAKQLTDQLVVWKDTHIQTKVVKG